MKSNYLICEDIDVGDEVYADEEYRKTNEAPCKVKVLAINHISAMVENEQGYSWTIMRNRLTKETKKDNI